MLRADSHSHTASVKTIGVLQQVAAAEVEEEAAARGLEPRRGGGGALRRGGPGLRGRHPQAQAQLRGPRLRARELAHEVPRAPPGGPGRQGHILGLARRREGLREGLEGGVRRPALRRHGEDLGDLHPGQLERAPAPPGVGGPRAGPAAAEGGCLSVLKWARAQGCPWDEWTCAEAAYNGHLAVLQWARDQGCPWDEKTCEKAAENGHLAVLQWARAQGCPWNEQTCADAAKKGHLAVLQWARAQGCPCNQETYRIAARAEVELLQETNPEVDLDALAQQQQLILLQATAKIEVLRTLKKA